MQLEPGQIVATIARLKERIDERFPGSSLGRVAGDLLDTGRRALPRAERIARPRTLLRAGLMLCLLALAGAVAAVALKLRFSPEEVTLVSFVQVLESAINDVVLLGAGIFFLLTLDVRLKRRDTMKALHELRSLAHIIDMHQLTKDPQVLLGKVPRTATSPQRDLGAWQLARYLDYCSELLALIGKLAAVYVERFDDPVALAAVDSIEDLTNGLSRKIWQKITLLGETTPSPGST